MQAQTIHTSIEALIKAEAKRLGFPICGFCAADPPAHLKQFESWLDEGNHADMHYLENEHSRKMRSNPHQLLPGCQTIICLATPYPSPENQPSLTPHSGAIASYAWGQDYHDIIQNRLHELLAFIAQQAKVHIQAKICVDTSPILEKDYAQQSGLGWIGKNSSLIIHDYGSHFFLSEILLDLTLNPDMPYPEDGCAGCTRCIEACPTQAILPGHTIDARRCISYLTIENRGTIAPEIRLSLGNHIFGCDVCQQVCPHNQDVKHLPGISLIMQPQYNPAPDILADLMLTEGQFAEKYQGTAIMRTKYPGYLRNLLVAVGNQPSPNYMDALAHLRHTVDFARFHTYDLLELITWATDRCKSSSFAGYN